MTKIRVAGSSDDGVAVDGDIMEEFEVDHDNDNPAFIGTSDGTLLTVEFTKAGIWRVTRLKEGTASFRHEPGTDPEDPAKRSDVVMLEGDIRWVICGTGTLHNG